jgi:hypothetical protein
MIAMIAHTLSPLAHHLQIPPELHALVSLYLVTLTATLVLCFSLIDMSYFSLIHLQIPPELKALMSLYLVSPTVALCVACVTHSSLTHLFLTHFLLILSSLFHPYADPF